MIDLLSTLTPASGLSAVWQFLKNGGVFMIPLGLASIVGVMAVVFKFITLTSSNIIPPTLAEKVIHFEQYETRHQEQPILQEFTLGKSSLARLCAVAVKHRGKEEGHITHVVEAAAREEAVHLYAGIGVLDVIVIIAPLLGLLGTASGLVVIFQGLGETTDHLMIARGISEALSTTITGLAIAVPCVIAQSYFTRRIEIFTARLESMLTDFAHLCQQSGTKS